jgi:hypothetical protein
MTSFSTSQVPPPSDWAAFESLCRDLWSAIWNDSNAQRNGRSGQNQRGVDVYGNDHRNGGAKYGIQCKGKDNYLERKVTIAELEREVEKAKTFRPKLHTFILATTGPKDTAVETRARELSEEHTKSGEFSVYVMGWEEIKERLERHPAVMRDHYKWLFEKDSHHPNKYLFDFWRISIDLSNLQFTCNQLPFSSYDVKFSGAFINNLQSFLRKIDDELATPSGQACALDFRNAIQNFARVGHELVEVCEQPNNHYDYASDIYTYWVDVAHLQYHEKGAYIE